MGVTIKVGGRTVHAESYRVDESSTPLAGGDSSGGVGTIEVTVQDLPLKPIGMNLEDPITLVDTARGSTLGTVREISDNISNAAPYSVTANNRLGEFNIEAQVSPFTGTLENAFRYYCSIANIDTGIVVDPALASRSVNFLGWNGNLWNHMKMMATAIGADLNLISNNVVLRPVRLFDAIRNREVESTPKASGLDLARKQEVLWYENTYVPMGLIYPSGGFRTDISPLSVAAGETQEYILDAGRDVNASIFTVKQPQPRNVVPPSYEGPDAVYTVIGDDNIVITPAQWQAYGGSVSVAIGEDTRSLVVTLVGATGIYQTNGEPMRTFRLGLSADSSTSTYQTLRITGSFIGTKQNSLILPTGVPDYKTGQEFAPTIDNPFLTSRDAAYSAGVRGARRYAGRRLTISANVSALNRRGQTGTANYPPYSYAQGLWGGLTYGSVPPTVAPKPTYGDILAQFYDSVQDSFDNQIYGNAPGARLWDASSRRYYRIRSASTEWNDLSVEGDDDLTNGDIQRSYAGSTYGDVARFKYSGLSYHKANLKGIAAGGYTPWVETRRNLESNPAFRTSLNGWTVRTGGGAVASANRVAVGLPGVPTSSYARMTLNTAGTWWRLQSGPIPVTAGNTYTLSGYLRGAPVLANGTVIIVWQNSGGGVLGESVSLGIPIGSSPTRASVTATAPEGAVSALLQFGRLSGAAGDFVDLAAVLFEQSSALSDYIDGSSLDGELERTRWTGAANASPSILETRRSTN